jgi:hypothetical protein
MLLTCPAAQIVSTFLKSLDIPWPNIFGVVMARVNVVNLNLVQCVPVLWIWRPDCSC